VVGLCKEFMLLRVESHNQASSVSLQANWVIRTRKIIGVLNPILINTLVQPKSINAFVYHFATAISLSMTVVWLRCNRTAGIGALSLVAFQKAHHFAVNESIVDGQPRTS
jgi:hypothetical protein